MSLYLSSVKKEIQMLIQLSDIVVDDATDLVTKQEEKVTELVKMILTSESYIKRIKHDMDQILADGKITMIDVPRMLSVVVTLNELLSSSLTTKVTVEMSDMKYVLYAVLYCFILHKYPDFFNQTEGFTIESFRSLYNNLWMLIEIDPKNIKIIAKKWRGLCCGESKIRK